jgi:class 3 adenylate cyclase/predicted metal-dependent HD superfamily phosphohydrolase
MALSGKTPEDLARQPKMEDPHMLAAMRILLSASAPAYFDDPNLMPYLALRMVRLSVKYGNAGHSAYGYVLYAGVLCGVLGNMPQGLAFGKLAIELVEQFNAQDIKGKVYQVFGGFVLHWNQKISETLPAYLDAANACLDAGDLEFHGYSRYSHLSYAYMSGLPLDQVWDLIEQHSTAVADHYHDKTQFIMRMVRKAVRDLRGPAAGPRSEDELAFDEGAMIELWTERDKQALAYYHKYRLVRRYMVRDYAACLESVEVITDRFHTVVGMLFSVYYVYFEALALTGLTPSLSGLARARALRRVRSIQKSLRDWSKHAPENHRPKYLLVTAELKRVTGKHAEAESAYEEAAQLAHRSGSLHDEALAYELLGEFHLALGRKVVARSYLNEAREVYRRWGGYGWIEHMEKRHAATFGSDMQKPGAGNKLAGATSAGNHELIDIATITQAARAISEKIVLDDVLRVVLHAAIVNAGAERGLLLLLQGDELLIKAEASSETDEVLLHSVPLAESDKVPANIINYVARSQQSIVINDASVDATFSGDPYFSRHQSRSIICNPLIDKGMLIGFLYLENALVHGAFTPARIQTLEVLAAQAAISLENARLYREVSDHAQALEIKVKERTEELESAYGMLRDIFGKYVPKRIAEDLVAGGGSLQPTQTTATILYSDIEGFTSIAENMPPEQVVEMLNDYFPAVIEPIERYGGIVNQFQGDAMLVTFNVPVADAFHAEKAVQAAMEIQRVIAGRKFAGIPLRTRIGINTGEVIAGNVGSGERVNYTVHGDAVNLAARIEQLNKEYGTSVLVSGSTVDLLQGNYPLELVGDVAIRGKTVPVNLFKLSVPNPGTSFENTGQSNEPLPHDENTLVDRFSGLWLRCANADADAAPAWRRLLQGYKEPRRFYHNLGHLVLCLNELDVARPHTEEFDATEMAVWFHDIIYDTKSADNELASAATFRELAEPHMPGDFVDRVCEFILATTHREMASDPGVAFMLDIDLSSFGLPWPEFLDDSQALKKEAAGIPDQRFYAGKLRFLDGLLQRPEIFQTGYFRERLEQRARDNIERYSALIRSQGFSS